MNIGNRLKEVREALNLSQQELASKLEITPISLSIYETNTRQVTGEVLERLYTCGININWIFSGKGHMFFNRQEKTFISLKNAVSLLEKIINADEIDINIINMLLKSELNNVSKKKVYEKIKVLFADAK